MSSGIVVRPAVEADLPAVEKLVDAFVAGHPAESQPRPREVTRAVFFGLNPLAHLVVACRGGEIVGMGQWQKIYDVFWGKFGAEAGWLFVQPGRRGLGIGAALVAEIAAEAQAAGCEFLHGGADLPEIARLYGRVAVGDGYSWAGFVGGSAFPALAALAGLPPREIVRRLPDKALNHAEPE